VSSKYEKTREFYDEAADFYGERYDPDNLLTAPRYSANYFRHQILLGRLQALYPTGGTVYEVGCGEGTPLVDLQNRGFRVRGCDISEKMVHAARAKVNKNGGSNKDVIVANIEIGKSLAPHMAEGPYDIVFAFGVFPHVESDNATLDNMRRLLKSDGTLFFEYRNSLFSLSTFNKLTEEFFFTELYPDQKMFHHDLLAFLSTRLDMNEPSRTTSSHSSKYQHLGSKYHNPLKWPRVLEERKLAQVGHHWYHFHAAPPVLEKVVGTENYRRACIGMEGQTQDWRGLFICSAGVVEAKHATSVTN
jgi:SAM-dependent methyltransferase